ncbi:hypothetical protein [Paractinoplanes toevensis]|uniref:Uncharacterized protein n=1 Tax=Paractinoplanes toevensis TaxID=571911 RepID=A0A919W185_9ACTN|nr:hypothetical protein [Actinoplanes toevensis]GIM90124.1 hypothetical protein Ato02nite_019170 [Actinoplanes toevensis]
MTHHDAPRHADHDERRSPAPAPAVDYDGLCPLCLRTAAVRTGHLSRHADGRHCAGIGWPGPPPAGAPTYGRVVDHLIDGELFTVDGCRWYCAAVPLFGNVAVYTSADRDQDCAPTVRVDADRDATVRVWRRPRVLLGHDLVDRPQLRHVPEGTPGAVELVWTDGRYIQRCPSCGALECTGHPQDPAVVAAFYAGLTA